MGEGLKEIDRLRKIAACFRHGDAVMLKEIDDALASYFSGYFALHRSMIARLHAAAKLAEGGA